MDLKIFVDTDADIRLLRRIKRDIVERGRNIEGVLKSYNRFVRQAYIDFIKPVSKVQLELFLALGGEKLTHLSLLASCRPSNPLIILFLFQTMRNSDLIVPHGAENDIAIQFISENLKNKLLSRGIIIRDNSKLENASGIKEFGVMFDVIDDVLGNYQKYSKQIYTIKKQHKDENGGDSETKSDEDRKNEHQKELDILKTQLSRMIIDADATIMKIHFESYAKRLIQFFQYYNPDFNQQKHKNKQESLGQVLGDLKEERKDTMDKGAQIT